MLLLTTRGHRTGEDHTVPLLYLRDGDRYVVVASYGGRPDHPTWYDNLVAEPRVRVQVRSRRLTMVARTAGIDERKQLWPRIVAAYGDYAVYQSRTDREIPVIVLDPFERH
jgi:deazaflavin-dependent oxidoreductase (nitroreductase family)